MCVRERGRLAGPLVFRTGLKRVGVSALWHPSTGLELRRDMHWMFDLLGAGFRYLEDFSQPIDCGGEAH
jgi:hypothetical protein